MKHARRSLPVGLLLLLALLLAGGAALMLWQTRQAEGAAGGKLAGSAIGGPFRLIDGDGNIVSNDSLRGKWRLMYFGYTFCPDICPVDAQRMAQALKAFEAADPVKALRIQPLFVTVDPERDGPAAVKEFAQSFHPRMIGLTGTPKQVSDTLATFRVYARKRGKPGDVAYLVDHSTMIYLFDPDGRAVTFWARDADPKAIANDIAGHVT